MPQGFHQIDKPKRGSLQSNQDMVAHDDLRLNSGGTAADMGTGYEERMGTEPVTRLIFQMALPAVVAQFVNLLYNIVDRIYIGHIAGHGADALRRWRWGAGTDGWLREFWAMALRWICFSRSS